MFYTVGLAMLGSSSAWLLWRIWARIRLQRLKRLIYRARLDRIYALATENRTNDRQTP